MDKKLFWKGYLVGILLSIAIGFFVFYRFASSPEITLDEIKIEDLNGNAIESKNLLNEKPLVLNFWATWCAPCVAEFPEFEKANLKYGDKVNFVMVSGEEATKILNFKDKKGYKLNILKSSLVLEKYGINAIPVTYFFDAKGNLIESVLGGIDAITLENNVEKLLKK